MGSPPLTMASFTRICDRMGDPPAPAADPPETLPAVEDAGLAAESTSRGEQGQQCSGTLLPLFVTPWTWLSPLSVTVVTTLK